VKLNISKRRGARIEMLPLIDIVFLLLVFFIYAMLSMAVHRALPIALPASETAEIDNLPLIAISVTVDGAVFIDKQAVELRYLSEVLENKTEVEKKKGVQVFADRLVEYHRLFMVLDSIKNAGISNISLQAQRDGGS
jgi:biopolymer transport protein ExbD